MGRSVLKRSRVDLGVASQVLIGDMNPGHDSSATGQSCLFVTELHSETKVIDVSDTDEQVIRSFESASSMRYGKRRNRERLSRAGSSTADVAIRQEIYTPLEEFHSLDYVLSRDTLASSSSMSTSIDQTFLSGGSSTTTVTPDNRDCTIKSRVINSQSPNGSPGRPIAADMHAFSESVKSKFSAASARYKESISKSTQSLKEKLLATNSPVKELSRGVQREMSAGIAGVATIFERLDPTLKRSSDGVNSNLFKGKCTQDNVIASPVHGNSADAIGNVSSNLGTMHL
uniref:E3 ubiquitin-protein ligase RHF1A-like n=1 Tax=Erigeron canadensis TaxID=72917 RepID=UPI001CB91E5B|nr:E3 ubiquitin-protein ligase RHF1A-like [Erigeron canadensis]